MQTFLDTFDLSTSDFLLGIALVLVIVLTSITIAVFRKKQDKGSNNELFEETQDLTK